MNFETIAVIKIIKRYNDVDNKIGKWLNKYNANNPEYAWSRLDIEKVIRRALTDYFLNCDKPHDELVRYFLGRDEFFIHNEFDAMISFIRQIQVTCDDCFINGFQKWNEVDIDGE